MKSLLKGAPYVPSHATDVAATFAREHERISSTTGYRFLRVAADAIDRAARILKEDNDAALEAGAQYAQTVRDDVDDDYPPDGP